MASWTDRSAPVRAPELDVPGVIWLNVPEAHSLTALRGKLVILDFWTLGCINCIHIVPTLRRVEEAFPDEVVVIGVHSPKFAAERDSERVRQATARYGVTHPVVHDPELRLWDAYAVRAWPTLVLVGPDGRIVHQITGEPEPEAFFQGVTDLVRTWRATGALQPTRLPVTPLERPTGRYSFPGKLKPVPRRERRYALADAGHHQIVLLDEHGAELARYGSGKAGLHDGDAETATFMSPQGLISDEDMLYVADTGNHAIRTIQLATGQVTTLAGTGTRGRILNATQEASRTALASPWDVELDGRLLYFANAGTHQLGVVDLDRGMVDPLAGTGGENLVDGPAQEALLAQPSGLALDNEHRKLYFVDSESSAVRVLSLGDRPEVTTLVGTGLFSWGHVNGSLQHARLQHLLGIAQHAQQLFVADSYNNALRRIDLLSGEVTDADADFICQDSLCRPLAEPAGITIDEAGRRLLVADTNNHRLLTFDLEARSYRTWAA